MLMACCLAVNNSSFVCFSNESINSVILTIFLVKVLVSVSNFLLIVSRFFAIFISKIAISEVGALF